MQISVSSSVYFVCVYNFATIYGINEKQDLKVC